MNSMLRLSAAALVVLMVTALGASADDEKEEKVPLDKVPKAVLDAVKAKFPKAKLVSAEKASSGTQNTQTLVVASPRS